MFSFFRSKPKNSPIDQALETQAGSDAQNGSDAPSDASRQTWFGKLKAGLKKTGGSLASVFTGTQIDEALYEELRSGAGAPLSEFVALDVEAVIREAKKRRVASAK